jgi:hypothetical protein
MMFISIAKVAADASMAVLTITAQAVHTARIIIIGTAKATANVVGAAPRRMGGDAPLVTTDFMKTGTRQALRRAPSTSRPDRRPLLIMAQKIAGEFGQQ